MDEKDFELLEVLDETRNITHAADKLYMTQSALSKRIKSMEQELGVEILLRSRQGIRFTPAGEKVLEHSRAALKQMEQLRRTMEVIEYKCWYYKTALEAGTEAVHKKENVPAASA